MEPTSLQPPPFPQPVYYQADTLLKDAEHVRLLSIFHFVFGGFALLGIGFLFAHFYFMRMIFDHAERSGAKGGTPPPKEFLEIMHWFYVFMAVVCIAMAAANILSGVFMRQKKNRMFSLVVAGFNCVQMPFGTALGVFTFVVLSRPTVRQLYGERLV
ncbi:MAG: hypothetical protein EOP87_23485 [Verrucomicrobiaceae bacterium]|nr:MAG: hypothetical protein EOP87_23485 [Verrucomicrobiaceae bacterium]